MKITAPLFFANLVTGLICLQFPLMARGQPLPASFFEQLDKRLLTTISNKSCTDDELLSAVSHLGDVKEPAMFWKRIADDSSYSDKHRARAIFALFRRHCYAETVKSLGERISPAQWLKHGMISDYSDDKDMTPKPPMLRNDRDSFFWIRVYVDWGIGVHVLGKISLEDFGHALRNEPVDWKKIGTDGIIQDVVYSDDYDEWLHRAAKGN